MRSPSTRSSAATSIEPFLAAVRRGGAGIFCLVKTSNAGGDVQDVTLSDGRPMWQHVAALVAEWGEDLVGERGLSSVGAVVGATHPRAVGEARRLMPQAILLLPGVGAQGGRVADLARAFTSGPASALVNASRSVIYAFRESGRRLPRGGGRRGGAAASARSGPSPAGSARRRLAPVRGAGRVPARGDDRDRARPGRHRRRRRHGTTDALVPTPTRKQRRDHDDDRSARRRRRRRPARQFYDGPGGRHVRRHRDARRGVPVATIERLNPKVVARPRSSSARGSGCDETRARCSPRLVAALLARRAARGAAPPPASTRSAWLVENAATGEVLAASHAHERLPIASITKLMTVLVDARASQARRRRHGRSARRRGRRVIDRPARAASSSPSAT